MEDTFTLLPLEIDPSTKAILAPAMSSSSSNNSALSAELAALNATHRALLSLDGSASVPPPPVPINPKRSAAIQKMREQGNVSLSRRNAPGGNPQTAIQDAIRCYSYAIDMALGRPAWEPATIVRDELAILTSNRSQGYIGLQAWPEAAVDAETSVEMKPAPAQGKAWWRRARSLFEMGRLEEAQEVVGRALEVEGGDGVAELKSLEADIKARLERKRGGGGGAAAAAAQKDKS